MLETASDIIRALLRYGDAVDPKTGSIIVLSTNGPDPHAEPFRTGFLAHLEVRQELVARLRRLGDRERKLVVLWYVHQWPVKTIARHLQVSRQHCYRLRGKALDALVEMGKSEHERPGQRPARQVVSPKTQAAPASAS